MFDPCPADGASDGDTTSGLAAECRGDVVAVADGLALLACVLANMHTPVHLGTYNGELHLLL